MAPARPGSYWLKTIDLCLCLALVGVPLCLGGRSGWGQLVLLTSASAAALAWIGGRLADRVTPFRAGWPELLLTIGGLWLALQVVPLPAGVVTALAPVQAEWLTMWTADGLGTWSTLSLAPAATARAAWSVVSVGLLFVVACQRWRQVEDVERFLKTTGFIAIGMAILALAQFATSNGRFLWFYEHPFTSTLHQVKGAFTNKNHFAQFMALGLAPVAWWLLQRTGGKAPTPRGFSTLAQSAGTGDLLPGVLAGGLGLIVFSGLLALSRGGALALGTATLVGGLVLYRHKQVSGRLLAGVAASGLLVAGCLAFYGFQDVSQRLEHWDPGVRLLVWDANIQVAEAFPWTGTGLGTHAEAYPRFLSEPFQKREFTHAENSPLQVASETGLPGLLLCGLAILGCFRWCRHAVRQGTDPRIATAAAAVAASLAAHLVHSLFDFLWYVPGCMVLVALLAAAARTLATAAANTAAANTAAANTAAANTATGTPVPTAADPPAGGLVSRLGWSLAGLLLVSGSALGVQDVGQRIAGETHWNEYLRLRFARDVESETEGMSVSERRAYSRQQHNLRVRALGRTITADPTHARAHLRLATHYMAMVEDRRGRGKNPHMPLAQIRQAALGAAFDSDQERSNWLDKPGVLGKNRKTLSRALAHSRRSLSLCPLQGMGYIYLAQLGYLEGDTSARSAEYFQQALAVRPHEARVHEAVGIEAWMNGDEQAGLSHWKRAFGLDRSVQRRILRRLATAGLPTDAIIREFDPDWDSLVFMKDTYRDNVPKADYQVVLAGYAEAARDRAGQQDGTDAVTSWLQAAGAFRQLDQATQAERCYKEALVENPASLTARLAYGRWLFAASRFAEALEHLEWSSRQQPDDEQLRRLVRACRRSAKTAPPRAPSAN